MALTVSRVTGADSVFGNKRIRTRTITFDSSYADNGEPLTAATLGLRTVEAVIPHGPFRKADGSDAISVSYDHTNSKLLAYWGNNDSGSDGPLIEVADTTDLSGYSGRVTCIGTGTP